MTETETDTDPEIDIDTETEKETEMIFKLSIREQNLNNMRAKTKAEIKLEHDIETKK